MNLYNVLGSPISLYAIPFYIDTTIIALSHQYFMYVYLTTSPFISGNEQKRLADFLNQ